MPTRRMVKARVSRRETCIWDTPRRSPISIWVRSSQKRRGREGAVDPARRADPPGAPARGGDRTPADPASVTGTSTPRRAPPPTAPSRASRAHGRRTPTMLPPPRRARTPRRDRGAIAVPTPMPAAVDRRRRTDRQGEAVHHGGCGRCTVMLHSTPPTHDGARSTLFTSVRCRAPVRISARMRCRTARGAR